MPYEKHIIYCVQNALMAADVSYLQLQVVYCLLASDRSLFSSSRNTGSLFYLFFIVGNRCTISTPEMYAWVYAPINLASKLSSLHSVIKELSDISTSCCYRFAIRRTHAFATDNGLRT